MKPRLRVFLVLVVLGITFQGKSGLFAEHVVSDFCNKSGKCIVYTVKYPALWFNNGYLAEYAKAGDYYNVCKALSDGWDPQEGNYKALQWTVNGALKALDKEKEAVSGQLRLKNYKKIIDLLLVVGSLVSADEYLVLFYAVSDGRLHALAEKLYKSALKQNVLSAKQDVFKIAQKWNRMKHPALLQFLNQKKKSKN